MFNEQASSYLYTKSINGSVIFSIAILDLELAMSAFIAKEGLVPLKDFANEHNITLSSIYVSGSNGNKFIKRLSAREVYIDTDKLYKYKEIRQRIWLNAHDNYNEFIAYFENDNKFAKWLSKYLGGSVGGWVDFLKNRLFCLPNSAVFSYRINDRLKIFWRATRMVLRCRDRRVKRIYERLPNRDRYDEIYKERGRGR